MTVVLADKLEYLYAARVLAGIAGGGTSIAIPLFVSEIADDTYVYHAELSRHANYEFCL